MNPFKLRPSGLLSIFTLFCVSYLLLATSSCKKVYVSEDPNSLARLDTTAQFKRFYLSPEQNVDAIHENITLEIGDGVVNGRIPFYSKLKAIVPTFETNAEKVTVNGQTQVSGVSAQDFSKPVTYRLTGKGGEVREYTVNLLNFTGLPVLRINTDGLAPVDSKETYVTGKLRFDGAGLYPDAETVLQIRGRGNSTWTFPKKPYKLKLGTKQSFFNAPEHKDWVLLANYSDKSQLRTKLAFDMGELSALEWSPRSNFVELFLNDVYQGTYQLSEGIEVAETRVNVGKKGFLLEVDQLHRMTPDDVYFNTSRLLLNIKEPEVAINDAQFTFIKNYLNDTEDALYGANFKDPVNGYAKYIDVESFADWYLINEVARNTDAIFYSSCFMNLAPNGKLKMGPLWDFDIGFGNARANGNSSPQDFYIKNSLWISRLFEDPAFVAKVKQRFAHFKSHKDKLLTNINQNAVSLKWSALENNNRWKTLYTETWQNYAVWGSYDNEVMYLKNWLNARLDWMEQALNDL